MLVHSRGIVLSALRYSDSSVISRIYTEQAGQKAFLIRIGKGRAAASKMTLLQPLTLLSLSFELDDRQGLRTPRSLERSALFQQIPFDTAKSSIAIFMAEIAGRALQEETPDPDLFNFLFESILLLDRTEGHCSNFHLKFLLELSRFLGCMPSRANASLPFFDLREAEFCTAAPLHPNYLDGSAKEALALLLSVKMEDHASVGMSNADRRLLLHHLVDYYRLHLHGMREIRSHHVLEEVMA
jgi:DNA repair protein RecO (recombination protein O)